MKSIISPLPFSPAYHLSLLLLRLVFGWRLIFGAIDNILSWERMLEFRDFLMEYHFPWPLLCAVTAVYAQFLAGICWALGVQVRIASAIMIFNFVVAIVGVHLLGGDSYLATAPAVHLLSISIVFFFLGPGKWSIEAWRKQRAMA